MLHGCNRKTKKSHDYALTGGICGKKVEYGNEAAYLVDHYENTPIQIYRKLYLQKQKIFR